MTRRLRVMPSILPRALKSKPSSLAASVGLGGHVSELYRRMETTSASSPWKCAGTAPMGSKRTALTSAGEMGVMEQSGLLVERLFSLET